MEDWESAPAYKILDEIGSSGASGPDVSQTEQMDGQADRFKELPPSDMSWGQPGEYNALTSRIAPWQPGMKYCKFCAGQIPSDAIVCVKCGRQVEALPYGGGPVIVNNNNNNAVNMPVGYGVQPGYGMQPSYTTTALVPGVRPKSKVTALLLCIFLGVFGAHKFYEDKWLLGIVYFLTGGLFGVGWLIDIVFLLMKPDPYFV